MKQWLILTTVICSFLLVWGTLIFQIIFKEEDYSKYARDLSTFPVEQYQRELNDKKSFVIEVTQEIKEPVKRNTELNKLLNPPLHEGIDYGQGISIDDLLENYKIVMNK